MCDEYDVDDFVRNFILLRCCWCQYIACIHHRPLRLQLTAPTGCRPTEYPNGIDNVSGKPSYTHKAVIVSSSWYWFQRYRKDRIISCGDDVDVHISHANGDLCTTKNADIVILNGRVEEYEWMHLQQLRHSNQTWVHTTEESPIYSRWQIPPEKLSARIEINLTQSYHPEADISLPYGEYFFNLNVGNGSRSSPFDTKGSKMIAWVSSHCSTGMWRRTDFAHALAKLVPVDMYGACGHLSCSREHPESCIGALRRYKFFLSLENSCCEGYITEKFWNALAVFEAIPVVVGAPKEDYLKFAPPNSFIHADDFESLEGLAEYLLLVSRRKHMYDSYFAWRTWRREGSVMVHTIGDIISITENGMCSLMGLLKSNKYSKGKKSFDPYGPSWMGGCFKCGHNQWLQDYFPHYRREPTVRTDGRHDMPMIDRMVSQPTT